MNIQEQNHPQVVDRINILNSQRIRETVDRLGEPAERVSEGLEEGLDNIEMKFNDVRDSIIDRTKEYVRTTDGYVNKNPWVTIGISVGFAFLIGMLVGRRRDN